MDNSLEFKGTSARFCNIEHFHMLMNNFGEYYETRMFEEEPNALGQVRDKA